jgi:hypothetical protein
MAERLSKSSKRLTPTKLTPIKAEEPHIAAGKIAQEKKNQELIKRRNEILTHRKREEEWFKIQFQLMTNAWDNLDAEGEILQQDQQEEGEDEEKPKEDQEMREVLAEISCYRAISEETRVYLCGGLRQVTICFSSPELLWNLVHMHFLSRQDGEECFSVTSWDGGTMISKGKGRNAGQPIIQPTRRESDMHNASNIARWGAHIFIDRRHQRLRMAFILKSIEIRPIPGTAQYDLCAVLPSPNRFPDAFIYRALVTNP